MYHGVRQGKLCKEVAAKIHNRVLTRADAPDALLNIKKNKCVQIQKKTRFSLEDAQNGCD